MVKPFALISTAFVCGFAGACSSSHTEHTRFTSAHYSARTTLSREHPEDAQLRISLVSIDEHGNTTIRDLDSGRIMRASPGGYFVGPEFGRHGLRLVSASRRAHSAVFERTFSG